MKSYTGEIVKGLGGKENVNGVYHCQTRLRFKLADVFEEVEKLVDTNKGKGSAKAEEEKQNVFEKVIDFVAGVFQPVIPALSGAGMVKALLALLVVANVISNQSQTYYLLNLFADGVFYFLPMMLAFTCAQKLKCNPILPAGVAAMMLHPNWIALVAAKESVHFFDIIPFTLANYGSSVIPIILIMGTLVFSVLGPIGAVLGNYLGIFFTFLSESAAWAPAVLVGSTLPVMVMFGFPNGLFKHADEGICQ